MINSWGQTRQWLLLVELAINVLISYRLNGLSISGLQNQQARMTGWPDNLVVEKRWENLFRFPMHVPRTKDTWVYVSCGPDVGSTSKRTTWRHCDYYPRGPYGWGGGEQMIEEWKGGYSHRDLARALLFFFQFISLLIYLLYAVQPNVKTKTLMTHFWRRHDYTKVKKKIYPWEFPSWQEHF